MHRFVPRGLFAQVARARHASSAASLDGGVFDVLVFPGQGAQRPGMAKDLHAEFKEARLVFEEIDEALKFNLSKLMFDGSEADLSQTENTQPALLAHSMAVHRVLSTEFGLPTPRLVAGHSVGEYAALASQGALSIATAAQLLRARGRAMQAAADAASGNGSQPLCMEALLLGPSGGPQDFTARVLPAVQAACDGASATKGRVACIAGINSPQQIVLSGHAEAVDAAVSQLKLPHPPAGEGGKPAPLVRRAVRLPVSAPFHSTIMAAAAEAMAPLLVGSGSGASPVPLVAPAAPLVSNVSCAPEADPARLRQLLLEGITKPVRWYQGVTALAAAGTAAGAGSVRVWELGPGTTLTGLVKQGWGNGPLALTLVNAATAKDVAAVPKL